MRDSQGNTDRLTMKYIDIFKQAYLLFKQSECSLYFQSLGARVLAWTVNHEHAVFELLDEVHPATVCVWFQYHRGDKDTIHKTQRIDGKWTSVEITLGSVPFVNNNPFDPKKDLCASNTAESVFPQNQ